MNENLSCNDKKQKEKIKLLIMCECDAQLRMLALVKCKKHDSLNHFNLV